MPTTKSDFWSDNYTPINSASTLRKRIAALLNKPGMRKDRQLINVLLGAVAGTTATVNLPRVKADQAENGGKRVIENNYLVNRASTAADDTDLTSKLLTYSSRPSSYPRDAATRP
jgi:hypothetical protein